MANEEAMKCPMCKGQGQMRRAEIVQMLSDPALRARIQTYLAELTRGEELIAAGAPVVRDFQKEVHGWNPQLPMWRRSPKE